MLLVAGDLQHFHFRKAGGQDSAFYKTLFWPFASRFCLKVLTSAMSEWQCLQMCTMTGNFRLIYAEVSVRSYGLQKLNNRQFVAVRQTRQSAWIQSGNRAHTLTPSLCATVFVRIVSTGTSRYGNNASYAIRKYARKKNTSILYMA